MTSAISRAVSPTEISKLLPMLITSPTRRRDSATATKPRTVSRDEVEVARRVHRAELDLRCARWRSA